jgi:hypothetical protein
LFDGIANFQALLCAAWCAVKGRRKTAGAVAFSANLARELPAFERQRRDRQMPAGAATPSST